MLCLRMIVALGKQAQLLWLLTVYLLGLFLLLQLPRGEQSGGEQYQNGVCDFVRHK